jgi:hypothetical protein
VLVSRRGALGTRLELTAAGTAHTDALVLTALLTITNEAEWRWYSYLQSRRDAASDPSGAGATPTNDDGAGENGTGELPDTGLPTYREAPFTRPLGPLLRSPSSQPQSVEDELGPPTDRPLVLTLSSRELLSGTFCEDSQPMVCIKTVGPHTTISQNVYTGPDPLSRQVAVIEWVAGKVSIRGQNTTTTAILEKKNSLFGTRYAPQLNLTHPT